MRKVRIIEMKIPPNASRKITERKSATWVPKNGFRDSGAKQPYGRITIHKQCRWLPLRIVLQ